MKAKSSPILDALDWESYQYLSTHAPTLLVAIEQEVSAGKSPEQVQRLVAEHVGSDRYPLAIRAYQAARHCAKVAE